MNTNAAKLSNETLSFIGWYSGMKKEQIEKAFEQWKIENQCEHDFIDKFGAFECQICGKEKA